MTETEMQTEFINSNMDILHKYLIWKETILPSQILDDSVEVPAEETQYEVVELGKDVSVATKTSGTSGKSVTEEIAKNYGIID